MGQVNATGWQLVISTIMEPLGKYLKRGDSLVDWGCGGGAFLHALNVTYTDKDLNMYGIDYSDSLVQLAQEKMAPNDRSLRFFVADVTSASFFLDESFDHALSLGVLFYLDSLDDVVKAITEMVRVTKPGGRII